jgi:hypothetical protein
MIKKTERRQNRTDRRKRKRRRQAISISLVFMLLSLFWNLWNNRSDAETAPSDADKAEEATPLAGVSESVAAPEFDAALYRLSKGEWGTLRTMDNRGIVHAKQVWVKPGGLMRIKKRSFNPPQSKSRQRVQQCVS